MHAHFTISQLFSLSRLLIAQKTESHLALCQFSFLSRKATCSFALVTIFMTREERETGNIFIRHRQNVLQGNQASEAIQEEKIRYRLNKLADFVRDCDGSFVYFSFDWSKHTN